MVFELITILVAAVLLCSWGIWKYSNAETNAYNEILARVKAMDSRIQSIETANMDDCKKISLMKEDLELYKSKPQEVRLTMAAPVSVDIIEKKTVKPKTPPPSFSHNKKGPLLKKVKKQMKELSQ